MANAIISIAMATFNGERWLEEQLSSLSSQTLKPTELVVCDDGSTDKTIAILQAFVDDAPFSVKIYQNKERLGYRRNFMKVASQCTGSLIAFCDQDDIWNINKLHVIRQYFESSNNLLVSHDFEIIFTGNDHQDITSVYCRLDQSGFSPVINIFGCTLTFRRELIDLVDWPPPQLECGHDTWLCLTAILLEKQGYIRQPLIRRRMHANNALGYLPGGRARLRRLLRRLQLPPFTSSEDLDAFVTHCLRPVEMDAYRVAVERCGPAMTDGRRKRALRALAKWDAIDDFLTSKAYSHPLHRALRAIGLFLAGAYRNGDGLLGLLQDIYGNRHGRL